MIFECIGCSLEGKWTKPLIRLRGFQNHVITVCFLFFTAHGSLWYIFTLWCSDTQLNATLAFTYSLAWAAGLISINARVSPSAAKTKWNIERIFSELYLILLQKFCLRACVLLDQFSLVLLERNGLIKDPCCTRQTICGFTGCLPRTAQPKPCSNTYKTCRPVVGNHSLFGITWEIPNAFEGRGNSVTNSLDHRKYIAVTHL